MKQATIKLNKNNDIEIIANSNDIYRRIVLSKDKIIINTNEATIEQSAKTIKIYNKEITFNAQKFQYEFSEEVKFSCGASEILLMPDELSFKAKDITFELDKKLEMQVKSKVNFN